MSFHISPIGNDQFFDTNGNLLVGGQLFTYLEGTSTKVATYTDILGGGSHTNPIELNVSGMPPVPIYIVGDVGYKFVLAPASDTDPPSSPIYTWDNIKVQDTDSLAVQQWVAGTTPTYISGTSFSVVGDQTATYQVGRRLKMVSTVGTFYGWIVTSAYTSVTTITVVLDSGVLDATLHTLSYSILDGQNTAIPNMRHSANNTTVAADLIALGDINVIGQDIKADDGASASTFLQFWVRVSSTLRAAYKWLSTSAYNAIFTHANSADRTYSLPNASCFLTDLLRGPSSIGSGSTISHEGTVTISSNQALSGLHFYTNFTLDASKTVTIADNSDRLIIVASDTITINGTIDGIGAGSSGGAGGAGIAGNGGAGTAGFTQSSGSGGGPGGGGGQAGAGQGVYIHGVLRSSAGSTSTTGDFVSIASIYSILGGSGGGGGAGGNTGGGGGGAGGRGGGSIVLIAPNVILGNSSVLNTSGANGGAAPGGSNGGGGGGGGAGNIYILCRTYTNSGATFTQSGGTGGAKDNNGGVGGAGAAGVKLILIYD